MPSFEQVNMQAPQLLCPYCQSPLQPDAKTWLCDGSLNPKGTCHPFDVARQGYVNLLPVQHKKSKQPGDSQQSIEARHRFLSQGFYQPLQQCLARLAQGALQPLALDQQTKNQPHQVQSKIWLDIGCGEGYYTQAIAQAISVSGQHHAHSALIGLDISKPAVALLARTAKQQQQLWYQVKDSGSNPNPNHNHNHNHNHNNDSQATLIYPMVASASHLPLVDNSIDGISSIFSPILATEFARVLKKGGRLLITKPDAGHLQSMREALFDEVRPHDSDKFLDELAPLFALKDTHHIQTSLTLNQQALADLMTMTPYSYRAKAEKREALLASTEQEDFKTEAKFVVYDLAKL